MHERGATREKCADLGMMAEGKTGIPGLDSFCFLWNGNLSFPISLC